MCEGANELAIIRILIRNGLFKYSEDDLLGLTPYHARQIAPSGQVKAELNMFNGFVDVIRIGDKQADEFKIPTDYKNKIVSQKRYCTKPELEMLLIISEGLTKEFEKVKSKERPKVFAKENIVFEGKKYDGSTSFYEIYFGNRPEYLCEVIRKYAQYNKSHGKEEHYLSELLKK